MKPALLALSFLLFAFPLAFSNDAQPVVDRTGKPVVSGVEYLILTSRTSHPLPGFVTLGKTGNSTSPATVEVKYDSTPAIPVKFIPAGANTSEIFTDTPLQIEFPKNYTSGVGSPKWLVVVDTAIQQTYVGVGVPKDHPGQQTYSGTFEILKSLNGLYDLAFSLPIKVDESPVSWNIKLFTAKEANLLSLTNGEPDFAFELIKYAEYLGIRAVV